MGLLILPFLMISCSKEGGDTDEICNLYSQLIERSMESISSERKKAKFREQSKAIVQVCRNILKDEYACLEKYQSKDLSAQTVIRQLNQECLFPSLVEAAYKKSKTSTRKSSFSKAKLQLTKLKISAVGSSIQQFYFMTGKYPQSLDDLLSPPDNVRPFYRSIPKDSWDTKFGYKLTPDNEDKFVVFSAGADKQFGTKDDIYQ